MKKFPTKVLAPAIVAVAICSMSAMDITTLDGKTYSNIRVTEVNPAGLVVMDSDGVFQLGFENLPVDIQKKYKYDPKAAEAYLARQKKAVQAWDERLLSQKSEVVKTPAGKVSDAETKSLQQYDNEQKELAQTADADLSSQSADSNNYPGQSYDDGYGNSYNYYGWGWGYPYTYNPYWNNHWWNHHYGPYYRNGLEYGKRGYGPVQGCTHSYGSFHYSSGHYGGGGHFGGGGHGR